MLYPNLILMCNYFHSWFKTNSRSRRLEVMVGIVTREHILQLFETLLLLWGRGGEKNFCSSFPHALEILAQCISFLSKIHEDNPWLSKILAKSFAAVQEILQCLRDGPKGCINDVNYRKYNQFDHDRVLSPLCVKLKLVDPSVRQAHAEIMKELEPCLVKVTTTRQSEGTDLLLVPLLCMISDIMPHM